MKFSNIIILFMLSMFSHSLFAVDDIPEPPSLTKEEEKFRAKSGKQKIPTIPDAEDDSRNIPQPEVRIIRKKDTVIEEYRVNGHLRFVKITPTVGPAYYLIDTDGDGYLETRENDLDNPPINQWILLEW